MTLKRRAAALGMVLVLILSAWLLGTYASPMTDRRIDRSVGTHLAGLEARVRALETLIGGGRQEALQDDLVRAQEVITSTTFQDLATVGPEVTFEVSRVGIVEFLVSASLWPNAVQTADGKISQAHIALELSGANVLSASNWETTHGYLLGGVDILDMPAGANITIYGAGAHRTWIVSGLNYGITTATMKYRKIYAAANNIQCGERHLLVMPL